MDHTLNCRARLLLPQERSIVSHHFLSLLLGLVLQLEALRQLKVKLDCGTLRQGREGVCGVRQMQQPDAKLVAQMQKPGAGLEPMQGQPGGGDGGRREP